MKDPPRLVDRVRLREAAKDAAIVALKAPSGYGKSVLARQLTDGQPVAWVQIDDGFDEIELSRCVLEALQPFSVSSEASQAGLATVGYALDEIATRGWIVVDDVHRLDRPLAASLIETILAGRPQSLRIVVAGWSLPLDGLLRAEAAGEAVIFEAGDLELDRTECETVLGPQADEIRSLTGGWPLAIGMAHTRLARGLEPLSATQRGELAAIVTEALSPELLALLVFLARLGRFTEDELGAVVSGGLRDEYLRFSRDHPTLIVAETEGWWRLQDVLAEALADRAIDHDHAQPLADRLRLDGHQDRLADVLLAGRRWDDLADHLVVAARRLNDEGRFGRLRSMVRHIPGSIRPAALDLASLRASMEIAKWDSDEIARNEMTEAIRARYVESEGDDRLICASILVDHCRYHGDPYFGTVAFETLSDWGDLEDIAAIEAAIEAAEPEMASALADLFGAAALAAGMSGVAAIAARSPMAYRLGALAAERAGTTIAYRAKNLHTRWGLGFRDPLDVAEELGPVIAELRRTGHPHVVNRLNDRADMLARSGRLPEARRDAEEALDWGERTGNEFALQTARATRFAIMLRQHGFDQRRKAEAEELWCEVSSAPLQARWLPYYAARMAGAAFDLGADGEADRWIARMTETQLGTDAFGRLLGWEVETIKLRRLLRSGRLSEADAGYRKLGGEIVAAGLAGVGRWLDATMAADWLVVTGDRSRAEAEMVRDHQTPERLRLESALGLGRTDRAEIRSETLRIGTMAGAVSIAWADEPPRLLTGMPAKLLALLVADGGSAGVERCLDVLWPEADIEIARNRFHGVTRRLRRKLGLSVDGPLTVIDGVVRLASTDDCELVVDAWQLESGSHDALDGCTDDFCAAQFPYDDFAIEARHRLRARLDALRAESR